MYRYLASFASAKLGQAEHRYVYQITFSAACRFTFVEREMTKTNTPMDGNHLEEADCFWNKAKKAGL